LSPGKEKKGDGSREIERERKKEMKELKERKGSEIRF
jgi:hypothetical protein